MNMCNEATAPGGNVDRFSLWIDYLIYSPLCVAGDLQSLVDKIDR